MTSRAAAKVVAVNSFSLPNKLGMDIRYESEEEDPIKTTLVDQLGMYRTISRPPPVTARK